MMDCTIEQFVEKKLYRVTPFNSVKAVSELMDKFQASALPVLENEKLVGIITSRDVRYHHFNRLVADAMTKKVVTVNSNISIWQAQHYLDKNRIKRLLVLKEDCLIGMLTDTRLNFELGKQTDVLTGLYRADYFKHELTKLLITEKEVNVIFLDINNFGNVNKKFGHAVGDDILRQVARCINRSLKYKFDYVCRYAGDEFAIVTKRSKAESYNLAKSIIFELEDAIWPYDAKVTGAVGIVGAYRTAHIPEKSKGVTVNELINQVSKASTEAKLTGQNIVSAGQLKINVANHYL